ncbi:EscE/YscE/SsaE family type III secretion system needle protein co-chaperone [Enterobacteriaceae bacterium H20N1]|uniref:EscE/YscE/SsaE family type III secretion system needle protein co-chaperone n=1 Tax=Dryocola boscaweniae TaxID=2925397 RepID=A0A9X2W3T2_9ENTR|nr:EscE/YscE/SsaE family type III secretion system needle protein co-chaperone [Dryocola boscaweniae]MCT4700508.1 EscE/YscE/SsaE family type III secretion system needle protein co-chaperone [Dryocola boscaweniae]MCT4717664.1 EscE/YscE/SsaE family type III secretion system needle protein co-chaperone [Dryocola boscaweniae]
MPSITSLELMLRHPDSRRNARNLCRLLQRRSERLRQHCRQPMEPERYQQCLQAAVACDAARETIVILYRRYHNQTMEGENDNDDT